MGIEGLGFSVLLASLAPWIFGLSGLIGVPVTAFCVAMIVLDLNTAYKNSNDWLELVHRVNWNYAGFGSWFDIHTIWQDDGSWHMLLLPYIDLFGTNCRILAEAYKYVGNLFGWNKWIWAGTYYG